MDLSIVKQPSALLPLAMSCVALALIVGHIAFVGVARQADEGAEAHLWQLLMAGQVPVMAYFAITWLPRRPGQSLLVLGMQAGAAFAALAPVFALNW
jgi:hypothetical protein